MKPVAVIVLVAAPRGRCLVETALGSVKTGTTEEITTDSFPGKVYVGWVGCVSPTAEFTPKNVETSELRAPGNADRRGSGGVLRDRSWERHRPHRG